MDRRSLKGRLEELEAADRATRFPEAIAQLRVTLDVLSPQELGEWAISIVSAGVAGYDLLPEEPPVVTPGYKRWREVGGLEAFQVVEELCLANAQTTTRTHCTDTFNVDALGITGEERLRAVGAALREFNSA